MTRIRVHAIEPRSRANGPGARFVVWFQGCSLGCAGCFNPATHALGMPSATSVDELVAGRSSGPIEAAVAEVVAVMAARGATALSLSGGEPLQQPEAALALLEAARARAMSTLAFSGYTIEEIREQPHGPAILANLDVLIDGRYVAAERNAAGLRGSANQRIHLLTSRHTLAEVEATPVAEIRIHPNGDLVLTGVNPLKRRALE